MEPGGGQGGTDGGQPPESTSDETAAASVRSDLTSDASQAEVVHLTRGFLFADLRGYASFVEAHGDEAAARLLESYRRLVRGVVARFGGAEIKTEGDSFYVVFPSASGAVGCGLAIVAAALSTTADDPELSIHVGVGVHAGETADTLEGHVGSAVNVAARICGLAAAGEVLVTDTVRGLTRTTADVRYEPRGRKHLKGIPEPMTLYAAYDARSAPARHGTSERVQGVRTRLAVGRVSASLVLLAAAALVVAVALGIQMLSARGTASPPATGPLTSITGAISSGAQTQASPKSPTPSDASTASPPPSPSAQASPAVLPLPEGPVDGGTYYAVDFHLHPELVLDSGWSVTTGSLQRSVDSLRFSLTDRPQSWLQLLRLDTLPNDPCALTEGPSGLDQSAFLKWLRSRKALTVGGNVPRRFPHVNAVQVDVTVNADQACILGTPPYVVIQEYGSNSGGYQLPAESTIRAYVFDLGSDCIVAIVQAPTADEFALFWPRAEAVLKSLDFHR